MKDLLTGKVVLISGGTQGLGAAIARAAAREGAAVVISGRNAERGEKVVAELQDTGADAEFRAHRRQRRGAGAGVGRGDDRAARPDRLPGQRGRVSPPAASMLDTTPELFDQHIAVNLRAPFFLMQAAIADMKQRGEPGSIVNVISIDSHGGQSFLAPVRRGEGRAGRADQERRPRPPLGPDPDQRPEHGLVGHRRGGPDPARSRPRDVRAQGAAATGRQRPGPPCRWANSARPTRSPTSSSSCCPTAAGSSPGRSSTGTRTSSAAWDDARRSRSPSTGTTTFEKENTMRLGLIGLGRIGAFHADTLSTLPAVDSLVVTDFVPAVTKTVAEKVGAEAADSPESLISSGVDAIIIAAATNAHTQLIRAGVEAGIPVFCEKPLSGDLAEAAAIARYVNDSGRVGADRLPPPLRPGIRRRPGRRRGRGTRLGAHGPVHHPGSGAGAARVHRGVRRHLPGLQRARLRHRPLGHRPGGRRGLRHRQRQGRPTSSPSSATSPPPRRC